MTDPTTARLAALERAVALLGRLVLPETAEPDAAFYGELRALLAGMGGEARDHPPNRGRKS